MAVDFLANVYGFTGLGKKIKIGHMKENSLECFPVGVLFGQIAVAVDDSAAAGNREPQPDCVVPVHKVG